MKKLIKDTALMKGVCLCIIIICILPLPPVNSSKQNLPEERNSHDDCLSCSEANFNIDPRCYDPYTRNCCRVCENRHYRSGDCYYHTDYEEWTFTCSKCGKGTYQNGYNASPVCLDCPDVTCPPNETYIRDCDKYSGEYPCGVPTGVPSVIDQNVTTESNTSVIATEKTTTEEPELEKVTHSKSNAGMIVGIVIGVLLLIFGGVVIFWYWYRKQVNQNTDRRDQQHGSNPEDGCSEIDRQDEILLQQQDKNPENGGPEIDDSESYSLKDGVNYIDFQTCVAKELPQNKSELHRFYKRITLNLTDYTNVEADNQHLGVVETRNAVLCMWVTKIGKPEETRVQLMLSAMGKVELRECRRQIINKCCCKKVPSSTDV